MTPLTGELRTSGVLLISGLVVTIASLVWKRLFRFSYVSPSEVR